MYYVLVLLVGMVAGAFCAFLVFMDKLRRVKGREALAVSRTKEAGLVKSARR